MSKIKILVCCHKHCEIPEDPIYLPIQVGKALHDYDLGIQTDNQADGKACDNISDLNNVFSEMTAVYWAWKIMKKFLLRQSILACVIIDDSSIARDH